VELVYTPASGGEPERHLIHTFEDGGGVTLGMYNTDKVKQSSAKIEFYVSYSTFYLCILSDLVILAIFPFRVSQTSLTVPSSMLCRRAGLST
jgi:hypothetical protein